MTFQRVRLLLESLQPTRVIMDPKPIKLTTRILPNHPTKDLQLVQSLQIFCLLEDSLQMGSKLLPQSIPKLSKYHDNFPELANCYKIPDIDLSFFIFTVQNNIVFFEG